MPVCVVLESTRYGQYITLVYIESVYATRVVSTGLTPHSGTTTKADMITLDIARVCAAGLWTVVCQRAE